MERLFVDTSGWYALLNRADGAHGAMAALLDSWSGRLISSSFVFDETVTLVRTRIGHAAAVRVGDLLLGGSVAAVVEVETRDLDAAWQQFRRDDDKSYSFTDCTSFAVMRRLGIACVAGLDEHFRQAGFQLLPKS